MKKSSFYNTKTLSEEEALKQEKYHLAFENLIHTMFCDPTWTDKYGRQKKLRVLTYCMYYQGITARQLLSTNITPSAELDSERVFLGRLNAAHLMHASTFRLPGENVAVYFLTASGAEYCCNKLLFMIDKCGLPVEKEAVQAIYFRYKKMNPVASVGHFLSIRDMHAYLLSQFSGMRFHYGIETGVLLSGTIMSISQSLMGGLSGSKRRQVAFVSDALFSYPSSILGEDCCTYIEQDMSTQHLNVLSGKVGNYTRVIAAQKRLPALHTVIFSLQTKAEAKQIRNSNNQTDLINGPKTVADGSPADALISGQECLASVPAVAYAYYGQQWTDTPVNTIADIYTSFKGNVGVMEKRYSNAAALLKTIADDSPELTLGELFDTRADVINARKIKKDENREKIHRQLYLSRQLTIRKATNNTDGLHEMFLRGFSICTTHNRAHNKIMPFLLPQINPDMPDHLKALSNMYYGTDFSEYPVYSNFEEDEKTGFTLRNRYQWSNGVTLFLENISDDIGGYERVLHYLMHPEWNGQQAHLICLVADDGEQVYRKLVKTAYYKFLQTGAALPLDVVYITYTQLLQARGLCTLTANGQPQSLLPYTYQQ